MEAVRARLSSDTEIAVTCFVTGTPLRHDDERPSDSFFTDMDGPTKGDGQASPPVDRCRRLLEDLINMRSDFVIRSPHSQMPASIDAMLNDGVVNTVRQIVKPDKAEEVGGLVVADHAEVLGHYDRLDALIGGKSYNTGLFHSGVAFGDDEFFGLPASRAGYPEDGPRCAPRGGTARAGHRVDPARMIAQQGAAR